MHLLQDIIITAIVFLIIGLVTWLNIHHNRRRAKMTPEERAADDEDIYEKLISW